MPDPVLLDLDIQGMTCASCVRRVEKKLNAVDGVTATVNLPLHSARVESTRPVDPAELIDVVERAGYGASVVAPDDDLPEDGPDPLRPRLLVAAILTVPAVLLSMIPALAFPGSVWVIAALTTPVAAWAAWPFHRSALLNARHGTSTMDTLVSIGVTAAYAVSLWMLLTQGDPTLAHGGHGEMGGMSGHAPVYFESAAVIVTFLLAGRVMEHRATKGASAALRGLLSAAPKTALLVEREGLALEEPAVIPAKTLREGDVVRVRPGDVLPADGRVLSGRISVDTSSMTGEPLARPADVGAEVHAGTVVVDGAAEIRAAAVGQDTQLAQIGRLVADAQSKKAGIARLADRISGVFVPVVLVLSALTLAGWWIATGSFGEALAPAVAVLVIACPCALGLATPVGLVAGTGRGAELGIFISGPQSLERASDLKAVLFDKTGTLTTGRMSVSSRMGDPEALRLAAALETRSAHPLAQAIAADLPADATPSIRDVRTLPGGGIAGRVSLSGGALDGAPEHEVLVGSPVALRQAGIALDDVSEGALPTASEDSAALIAVDGRYAGAFTVSDSPRPEAAETVRRAQAEGLEVYMLTGDRRGAAERVAGVVGIPAENVRADLLPEDKVTEVARIRGEITERAGKAARVVMVGDGLNDAAALAAADLGISLTTGADAAQGAADLTILGSDLGKALTAIRLSRATLRTIKGNLGWAFVYNVIGIPVAAAGLLNPMVAGAAMALSSVLVVANSLRLRAWKP
jgi:Cu+-exporting ATPase